MDRVYLGIMAVNGHVLLTRRAGAEDAEPWSLPRELIRHGHDDQDAILHFLRDDLGLIVVPNRFIYEDFEPIDGAATACYFLTSDTEEQRKRLEGAADLNALLENKSSERDYRWLSLAECRSNPEIARAMRYLDCQVERWASRIPYNWVEITDKVRELAHAIRRTERYFDVPEPPDGDPDPLYASLNRIDDYVSRWPNEIWEVTRKWAVHPRERVRTAVACCVLEHMIGDPFDLIFPKVDELARKDLVFASTFLVCYQVGQADLPRNRERFAELVELLKRNRGEAT